MVKETLFYLDLLLAGVAILILDLPFLLEWLRPLICPSREKQPLLPPFYTFVITSYKNLEICEKLLDSIFNINYPSFEVIIIADQEESPLSISHPKLRIYRPETALASKIRSLQYSDPFISPKTSGVVVLDPDNLVHPDFLWKLNDLFLQPYSVVQGQRRPKNLNSTIARIDALGELYHNYTDRDLPFSLGSSASIAGSAMCIERTLFSDFLHSEFLQRNISRRYILGEDKLLQNYLVSHGHTIAYAMEAIVYDEKVLNHEQMTRQRARWINTYFNNSLDALKMIIPALLRGDWNALIFGIVTGRPPLFLTLLACVMLGVLNAFLYPVISIVIGTGMIIFMIHFFYVCVKLRSVRLFGRVIFQLPAFMYHQLRALFQARKFRNSFGNTTPTQHLTIEDVMNNDRRS